MTIPVPSRPLDDVMIAMDVVDTLRHDQRIAERELNDEARRAELIERLRNLYKGQGIDVPDEILAQGVKALEERRFVYEPPALGWQVRLARLYVQRARWGRWAIAGLVGVVVAWGGWHFTHERPRQQVAAAIERELKVDLPRRVTGLMAGIEAETKQASIVEEAKGLARSAEAAASRGDAAAARQGAERLAQMLAELQVAFDVRIISRKGEVTGLWRVPKVNREARNYYIVVEAVDAKGALLERRIHNEETGVTESVKRWAVRVPKPLFDEIQADKLDDGIVQKAVLGRKVRGALAIEWLRPVEGGAITKW